MRTTKEQRAAYLRYLESEDCGPTQTVYAIDVAQELIADLEDAEQKVISLENRLMCSLTPMCECPKHLREKLDRAEAALQAIVTRWGENPQTSVTDDMYRIAQRAIAGEKLKLTDVSPKLALAAIALEKCRQHHTDSCPWDNTDPDSPECTCGAAKQHVWLDEVILKVRS